MNIEHAIETVLDATGTPPQESPVATELHDGLTNTSFLVTGRHHKYVVRFANPHSEFLGLSRTQERQLHEIGAALNLSPELIFFDDETGTSITEFIETSPETWSRNDQIKAVADMCKTLHTAPVGNQNIAAFDPVADIERWQPTLPPSDQASVTQARQIVAKHMKAMEHEPDVLIHNDFAKGNVLFAAERAWLIDWEYAAVSNKWFDLASYARTLQPHKHPTLLQCYFDQPSPEHRETLNNAIRCISAWTHVWALVQHRLTKSTTFDYRAYAKQLL